MSKELTYVPPLPDLEKILERNGALCMDDENDRTCLAEAIRRHVYDEFDKMIRPLAEFILAEVPGYPMVTENEIDSAIGAIKEYQRISQSLWHLLDEIDKLGSPTAVDDLAFKLKVSECVHARTYFFLADQYGRLRRGCPRSTEDVEELRAHADREPRRTGFLIYDEVDNNYHSGGGEWTEVKNFAFRYPTRQDAIDGLDDVDCERILRDRLRVVAFEGSIPRLVSS